MCNGLTIEPYKTPKGDGNYMFNHFIHILILD